MKNMQSAKLKMQQGVLDVMNGNEEIWGVVPQLKTVMEVFSENVKTVDGLIAEQEGDIKTLLDDKPEKRKELIDLTLPVLNVLLAYGNDTKDKKLLKKLNFSRNKLTKSKDLDLIENCKFIYKTAHKFFNKSQEAKEAEAENTNDILSYGLNDKMLEEIKTAEKAFIKSLSGFNASLKNRNLLGKQITSKLKENDKLLRNKMDLLISIFEKSNPELFNKYSESRIIQKETVKEEEVKKGKKKKD
jgi:hypothetical protein